MSINFEKRCAGEIGEMRESLRGQNAFPKMKSEQESAHFHVIKDMLNFKNLAACQIESYDFFIKHQLPHIFSESSEISCLHSSGERSHHVYFTNVTANPPSCQEQDNFFKPLLPYMSRLRGFTYSSCVTVDVVHDIVDQTSNPTKLIRRRVHRNIIVANIPVMVRSCLCYLNKETDLGKEAQQHECAADIGGYFIISGNEKTLIAQAKLKTNHVFVFPAKTSDQKFLYTAELRSVHEAKLRSTSTLYVLINDISNGDLPNIVVKLPFLKAALSPFAVFVLLGFTDVDEIIKLCACDDEDVEAIISLVVEYDPLVACNDADGILDVISKSVTTETTRSNREAREKYLRHIIISELAPHMGVNDMASTMKNKAIFFGHILQRLISVALEKANVDDRDEFEAKRVDSAGALLSLLVRQHYRGNLLRKLSAQLRKNLESNKEFTFNVGDIISHKLISGGLRFAFATGTWGILRGGASGATSGGGQTGVAQILPRLTAMAALSAIRKVNLPISREGRTSGPRMLHESCWGYFCPADTPEGVACGLVSTLAIGVHVRVASPMQAVACVVLSITSKAGGFEFVRIEDSDADVRRRGVAIFVNGTIVAYSLGKASEIASLLRYMRRVEKKFPFDCSIFSDEKSVRLSTDHGAFLRPLIVYREYDAFLELAQRGLRGEIADNIFKTALLLGYIEFIDAAEVKNMLVKTKPPRRRPAKGETDQTDQTDQTDEKWTHVEIHACLINGVCVSQIPFCNHNQSPRVAYQAAQSKQSIGMYTTNFVERLDTIGHVLVSPQRAIVSTRLEELLGTSVVRSGSMPIVAIASYSGFNQDDSILLNSASVERGLFHTISFHTFKEEERGSGADCERFENPMRVEGCGGLKVGNYEKIGDDGLPFIGTTYFDGDILIGKTIAMSALKADKTTGETRREIKRDKSLVLRSDEPVVVDAIMTSRSAEGKQTVKVRTRSLRVPVVGDKFSARHGQKGVCGKILAAADFPFSKNGVVPDLIINPHAIPSRMTIGMILEMLLSKVACLEGATQDGTPFSEASGGLESFADRLASFGYEKYGRETLMNGVTGEELATEIFIAPCNYQRLKHMVVDKAHARSRGATQLLTRAPTEGRSRDGGLRVGEMEKDAITSWGASALLQDRLFEQSDAFEAVACGKCGNFSYEDDRIHAPPPSSSTSTAPAPHSSFFCVKCGTGEFCSRIQVPFSFKLLLYEIQACGIEPRMRFKNV